MKKIFKIFKLTLEGKLVACEPCWIEGLWFSPEFETLSEAEIALDQDFFSYERFVILPVYLP